MADDVRMTASVRFVPAGIYTPQGRNKPVLRGAIIIMPDQVVASGSMLARWPAEIQDQLNSLGIYWQPISTKSLAPTPSGPGTPVANLSLRYEPNNVARALEVWKDLLRPDWTKSRHRCLGLLLRTYDNTRESTLFPAVQALKDPWGSIAAVCEAARTDHNASQLLATSPASSGSAGSHVEGQSPRVSSAPLAKTAQLLNAIDSVRTLDTFCRSLGSPRGLVLDQAPTVPPRTDKSDPRVSDLRRLRWTGVPGLFSGPRAIAPKPSKTEWASWVVPRVAARGLASMTELRNQVLGALRGGTEAPPVPKDYQKFRYLAPPPLPEVKITAQLQAKIHDSIATHADVGANIFRRTKTLLDLSRNPENLKGDTNFVKTEAVWISAPPSNKRKPSTLPAARLMYHPAPVELIAAALWPSQRRAADGPKQLADFQDSVQTAIAMHLIDIRPDEKRDFTQIRVTETCDPKQTLKEAAAELDQLARDIGAAPQRRLFGLLAYPALARALRLVVDVEFDLPAPDQLAASGTLTEERGADFLWLGASLAGKPIELWTASKLRSLQNPHFGVCSREEVAIASLRSLDAISNADDPNPPQLEGIVTLGGDFDTGGSRFTLESLDVITRLEQYINASEGEASAEQGGQSLEHPGAAVGPPRTAGLVLHDRGRGAAVTTQLARVIDQVSKAKAAKSRGAPPPTPLFADDLNVGFRPDIGVLSRSSGQLGIQPEWRSLSDRWVRFDDQKIEDLVTQTLKEARPQCLSVEEFRLQIDAQSVKFPNRVIVDGQPSLDDKQKEAQQVALEIVLRWNGPPLAAPPADGADEIAHSVALDPATDLMLGVTIGPISGNYLPGRLRLPPWLEVGRGFRLGMRGICLGGIAVSLEEASRIYNDPKNRRLTLPQSPGTGNLHVFRRHEPVAPPAVALVYQGPGVPPKDSRGDTLTGIVVRSRNGNAAIAKNYRPTPRSIRAVYVQGVPMSFAALHPTRPDAGGPRHMILHGLRTVRSRNGRIKRLCGGLQFLSLDPECGGLPIGWQGSEPHFPVRNTTGAPGNKNAAADGNDSVFWVHSMRNKELVDRKAQYFPDPAVAAFIIEARVRGPRARAPERKIVPIYNPRAWQAVTHDGPTQHREAVEFPHAMPIFLEVKALTEAQAAKAKSIFDDSQRDEVGAIIANGHFDPHGAGSEPSITATRVRINLAPGQQVDLRIWSALSLEVVRDWFESTEQIASLFTAVGEVNGQPGLKAATAGLRRIFAATESQLAALDLESGGFSAKDIQTLENLGATPHVVRHFVAQNISKALTAAPVTGLSQEVTLTATHAILQPRFRPAFVRRDSNAQPLLCHEVDENPLGVLRHTFKAPQEWTLWLQIPNHRDVNLWRQWLWASAPGNPDLDFHEKGAVAAWFGGIVALDLETTSQLILRASYLDVNDDPAVWPSPNHPLDNEGKPVFDRVHLELFRTADLQKEGSLGTIKDELGHDLDLIDLIEATDGTIRGLSWQFQDGRARHLTLHYVAVSRFWNYFVTQKQLVPDPKVPEKMSASRSAFELEGESRRLWLPSTRRPDPIAKIEFLPAFVYVTEEGLGQRSRHVRARLRMRRAKAEDGGWFSSGEGEQLAVILWPPDLFTPCTDTNLQDNFEHGMKDQPLDFTTTNFNLGAGGKYVSRWGSDPIREGGPTPNWLIPPKAFQQNLTSGIARLIHQLDYCDPKDKRVNPILMPVPVPDSNSPPPAGAKDSPPPPLPVCLLCFDPIYDPVENLWYVDIAIDPGPVAMPFVRLGLARYQEHSLRELEVSEPITLQFRLEPYRRIQVYARPKRRDDPGWPVEIRVCGPSSVVAGGRRTPGDSTEPAQAAYQRRRTPHFSVRLLHDGHEYLEKDYVARLLSETDDPPDSNYVPPSDYDPPADDEIWRATLFAPVDPANARHPHEVIVEEVDLMLSASITDIRESRDPIPTGPRFAAKVRVRSLPPSHQ